MSQNSQGAALKQPFEKHAWLLGMLCQKKLASPRLEGAYSLHHDSPADLESYQHWSVTVSLTYTVPKLTKAVCAITPLPLIHNLPNRRPFTYKKYGS